LYDGIPEEDIFRREAIFDALSDCRFGIKSNQGVKVGVKDVVRQRRWEAYRKEPVLPRKRPRGGSRQMLNSTLQMPSHVDDGEDLPIVDGDGAFAKVNRDIVERHRRLFRRKVNLEPAAVPPMELKLSNPDLWFKAMNKQASRPMSSEKAQALKTQIDTMLAAGIISSSVATHWSQCIMVPKPGQEGQWRLVVDYRNLNEACEGMGWPLPNIKTLLYRIGQKKAKYFAVLDLTSGYHQVLLAKKDRALCAFMTPWGLYEPNRISMGLKSAPSYFQKQISEVLSGLLYTCCELYIDDIIIWGDSEEQYARNLSLVLQRLEDRNLTLNPAKAKLGLSEVEAVGHVIDQYGISMSEKKINKVMDFPVPHTKRQLKSFLGLANYFRDHIKNYSRLSHPLDQLCLGYQITRHRAVQWTKETRDMFEELREAIRRCPKLYFLDDNSPVHLETDASDYGIGAYLYQKVYDPITGLTNNHPVAFMSKTLQGAQRNWSTIEKEAYAIYWTLKKLEYLLRDITFDLLTDNRNITFIYKSQSKKVENWRIAIQHFRFNIKHVMGSNNVVADCLSRINPPS
jgi:hypothetical protein